MKLTLKRTLGLAMVTLLLVATVPFGTISPDVSAASSDRPTFTVKQASGTCYVVQAYEPSDSQVVPSVVRTDAQGEKKGLKPEFGPYTNPNWDGTPTIESIMDYRFAYTAPSEKYPYGQTAKDAPYLAKPYRKEPWQVSTYGMYNWSANQQSNMWFYDGPDGISLVVRHDRLGPGRPIASQMYYWSDKELGWHKDSPGGGAVSMEFKNLPQGQWAYMDDYTPKQHDNDILHSGNPPYDSSAYQSPGAWDTEYYHYQSQNYADGNGPALSTFHGGDFRADWAWRPQTNDGGAYRGLENMNGPITIENQFNQNAVFWNRYTETPQDEIKSFELRGADGKMHTLDMGSTITIERGSHCGGQTNPPTSTPPTSTPQTSTPQTSTPPTSTPQTSTPQTTTPQTSTPQTSTSQTSTPQTTTPQTSTPQTTTPQTSTPPTSTPPTSTPPTSTPPTSTQQTSTPHKTTSHETTSHETTSHETSTSDDSDSDHPSHHSGSGHAHKGKTVVRNVHVDRESADDGTVTISAMVLNTHSDTRTETVNLTVDGKVVNSTDVTLSSVSAKSITFTQQLDGSGTHTVSIGGHETTVHVQDAKTSTTSRSSTSTDDSDSTTKATSTQSSTSETSTAGSNDGSSATSKSSQSSKTTDQPTKSTKSTTPGFTAALTLVALLAAAALAVRRS